MPFLIKSKLSSGERECHVIKNQGKEAAVREDIIRALKGLTFKFEVRITDVVPPSGDTNLLQNGQAQSKENGHNDNIKASLGSTTNGSSTSNNEELEQMAAPKTVQYEHIPMAVQAKLTLADKSSIKLRKDLVPSQENGISSNQFRQNQNRPDQVDQGTDDVGFQPKSIDTTTGQTSTDSGNIPQLPNFSNSLTTTPDMRAPSAYVGEGLTGESNAKTSSSVNDTPATTTSQTETVKPEPMSPIVRSSLKIGDVVKTCCISVDDTVDPPMCCVPSDSVTLTELTNLIRDMESDIESQPTVSTMDIGDIVLAKSTDDESWYRAIVESVTTGQVKVNFFDWGLTENLDIGRIRRLTQVDLGMSRYPACAHKVQFVNPQDDALVTEALQCENEFYMRVESYDETNDTYQCTILNFLP